jgi:hypothetical protein
VEERWGVDTSFKVGRIQGLCSCGYASGTRGAVSVRGGGQTRDAYCGLMRTSMFVLAYLVFAACGSVRATQCEVAADCADLAAFCIEGFCSATCESNADCVDPDRPLCAADGACVGCVDDAGCEAAAPVCDAEARVCRGCAEDGECSDGVCIDAEGTCVADAEVGFVAMGGTDGGACLRTAPCETVGFAATSARVVHVLGDVLPVARTIVLDTDGQILDGDNTVLLSQVPTTIQILGRVDVIVEGVQLAATDVNRTPAVRIESFATARLHEVEINGTEEVLLAADSSTTVTLTASRFGTLVPNGRSQGLFCAGGTMRIEGCRFERAFVRAAEAGGANSSCELTVRQSRFDSDRDDSVEILSGLLVMENNLIIHRVDLNDSINAGGLRTGSAIRFNTVTNTTPIPSDGAALFCDATVEVTSNIFAYNSENPIRGTCAPRFSVFDSVALTSAGTGNAVAELDAIFVDREGDDYHLAADSVARGRAEPNLDMVTVDLDGQPRPNPAGSTADSGAFEAP